MRFGVVLEVADAALEPPQQKPLPMQLSGLHALGQQPLFRHVSWTAAATVLWLSMKRTLDPGVKWRREVQSIQAPCQRYEYLGQMERQKYR